MTDYIARSRPARVAPALPVAGRTMESRLARLAFAISFRRATISQRSVFEVPALAPPRSLSAIRR